MRRRISCKTVSDSELPDERCEWPLFGYWYVQLEIEGTQSKAIKQHIWQAIAAWKCLCFSICTGTPRRMGSLLCRRWLNNRLQGEAEGWSIWCDTVGLCQRNWLAECPLHVQWLGQKHKWTSAECSFDTRLSWGPAEPCLPWASFMSPSSPREGNKDTSWVSSGSSSGSIFIQHPHFLLDTGSGTTLSQQELPCTGRLMANANAHSKRRNIFISHKLAHYSYCVFLCYHFFTD